jgi:hypothetical protein
VIQNTAKNDFRRLGLSLERVSSDALSLGRATNAGTVVASADDVCALPTLGGMVRIMGFHHRCTFTRGGRYLLEALITKATTQEMVGMGVLASSEREGIPARKIGPSGFPKEYKSSWTV